jgi:hypothetical protein
MEVPLDSSITIAAYRGYMPRNSYKQHNSAMAFASMGVEIKSPPGNSPYRFRIYDQTYHFVSPLHPNQANTPGHGLYIFDSAEATTKRIKNKSNQGCLAEVMQRLNDMLRWINPLLSLYTNVSSEMKYKNKEINAQIFN